MRTIAKGGAIGALAVVWGMTGSAACSVTVDSHSEIVREEKQFKVSGTPTLRLTTFDGSIGIEGWDKPHVAVEIEKRGGTREAVEALEVKTEQKGDVIELEVKRPRSESFQGIGLRQSANARLTRGSANKLDCNCSKLEMTARWFLARC